MTENYPITPPPELVEQWRAASSNVPASLSTDSGGRRDYIDYIATQAARWGADQELEACCEWLQDPDLNVDTYKLRAARRPKPPSLKEQALETLRSMQIEPCWINGINTNTELMSKYDILRRALEQLDD